MCGVEYESLAYAEKMRVAVKRPVLYPVFSPAEVARIGFEIHCIMLDSSIAASAYAGHLHSKSAIPPTLPAAP
ncbi:hypothetical protein K470DRAFT_257587 [Piedraia hortae CBS 480.64]|uniref:Uncharacterized protein n=1 Tax=Piedraia hortae CBS 480.64 TaxID=1314780 RepID=A0A6A7C018_9PEZI|nr:hypothetical protein K470DRAFT_257587 [Piedraia hortae CBS 480.64]